MKVTKQKSAENRAALVETAARLFRERGIDGVGHMTEPKPDGAATLSDQLNLYLSLDHRDNLAGGCAMAASASEIGRQDEAISARLAVGFEEMVGSVQAALEATTPTADARARALTIAAAMIGGVAMARAAAKSRPDLSDEIMTAVRRVLGEVGGEDEEPRN
jgi:TetR/AcrR family transcriptional repressor of nem operon